VCVCLGGGAIARSQDTHYSKQKSTMIYLHVRKAGCCDMRILMQWTSIIQTHEMKPGVTCPEQKNAERTATSKVSYGGYVFMTSARKGVK
jgi:shikimate kinase